MKRGLGTYLLCVCRQSAAAPASALDLSRHFRYFPNAAICEKREGGRAVKKTLPFCKSRSKCRNGKSYFFSRPLIFFCSPPLGRALSLFPVQTPWHFFPPQCPLFSKTKKKSKETGVRRDLTSTSWVDNVLCFFSGCVGEEVYVVERKSKPV